MEDSQKRIEDEEGSEKSPTKIVTGEFQEYLVNALNDSLIKKSKF